MRAELDEEFVEVLTGDRPFENPDEIHSRVPRPSLQFVPDRSRPESSMARHDRWASRIRFVSLVGEPENTIWDPQVSLATEIVASARRRRATLSHRGQVVVEFRHPAIAGSSASPLLLALIRKRRFLDFYRAGGVAHMAELETQVLEIAAGSRMVQEFVNDGLVVG